MQPREPRAGRLAVVLALLVAPACAVKAPPRHVWTLAPRDAAAAVRRDPAAPAVAVRRFTASEEVRTTSLTSRRAEGRELVRYPDQSWADYPDRLLEQVAVASLAASGRFSSVTAAPAHAGVDAVLSCRVLDFSEWQEAGGRVARVALRWSLDAPDGVPLGGGVIEESAAVAGAGVEPLVTAFETAAKAAAARLVEESASALRDGPAARGSRPE